MPKKKEVKKNKAEQVKPQAIKPNINLPFFLIIIGAFISIFLNILAMLAINFLKNTELLQSIGLTGNTLTMTIVSSIVSIALSIAILVYSIKIKKAPKKSDFIITLVVGIIGILFGMGIGSLFVIIGSIIGIIKLKKV